MRQRLTAKLKSMNIELKRRRHQKLAKQRRWLSAVPPPERGKRDDDRRGSAEEAELDRLEGSATDGQYLSASYDISAYTVFDTKRVWEKFPGDENLPCPLLRRIPGRRR